MTCAACSARVERAVGALEGVDSCEVNLLLGTMSVTGEAQDSEIISAVVKAGYGIKDAAFAQGGEPTDKGKDEEEYLREQRRNRHRFAIRLISSATLLLFLMYVSMGHVMWGFPLPQLFASNPVGIGLLQLVISSIILVINKHFFINGVRGIVNRAPNMDTLVALGSGASFIYSLAALFAMTVSVAEGDSEGAMALLHGLYFESAAMILVLITVGKLLEAIAKGRTTSAIRELMLLTPPEATVERDGAEVRIPTAELKVGDIMIVRQGENISADGEVVFGEGSINEAMLTGESLPVDRSVGAEVFGGTTLLSGYLKVRVLKVGEDTALSEIVRMVKDASGSKAPVAKIADKVSGIFVPAVMTVAIITAAVWLLLGAEVGYALSRGVSVLVISCPCALGLATPVAIMVGSGVGARCGLLFKNATALEMTGRIRTVVLDKTGTVTEGKPYVSAVMAESVTAEELVARAAALEKMSEHPLARAIVEDAENHELLDRYEAEDFSATPGGVSGLIEGKRYFCGNLSFTEKNLSGEVPRELCRYVEDFSSFAQTPLILSDGEEILGIISLADKVKADSAPAVRSLRKMGLRVVMLTGDNERCAASVASRVGIEEYRAEVLPKDKADIVRELQAEGRVCMVGDGINDAPALTTADVGMAIGAGAHIAIDAADVVLAGGELTGVLDAIRLGRRTLKNIYLNLFWAFCYNIVGIPLAAGAFTSLLGWSLSPMFGALAMSLSSFLVVTSSLSINLFSPTRYKKTKENSKENVNNSLNNSDKEELKDDTDAFENDNNEEENNTMEFEFTIRIEGMMCPHCSGRVKAVLEGFDYVKSADVSHERGDATVIATEGYDIDELEAAIENAGYKVIHG